MARHGKEQRGGEPPSEKVRRGSRRDGHEDKYARKPRTYDPLIVEGAPTALSKRDTLLPGATLFTSTDSGTHGQEHGEPEEPPKNPRRRNP